MNGTPFFCTRKIENANSQFRKTIEMKINSIKCGTKNFQKQFTASARQMCEFFKLGHSLSMPQLSQSLCLSSRIVVVATSFQKSQRQKPFFIKVIRMFHDVCLLILFIFINLSRKWPVRVLFISNGPSFCQQISKAILISRGRKDD